MFNPKTHSENKNVVGDDASKYLEEFKSSLTSIVFLMNREYTITQARFFSLKKPDDSNYYNRDFEEFVDLEMLVVGQYKYHATLARKHDSKNWQFIPNTAY